MPEDEYIEDVFGHRCCLCKRVIGSNSKCESCQKWNRGSNASTMPVDELDYSHRSSLTGLAHVVQPKPSLSDYDGDKD